MATLGELLGREAGRMNYLTAPLIDGPSVQPDTDNALTGGQARRAWINALTDGNLDYYLGPTGIPDRLRVVNMMNPVADMFEAMQNSRVMMDGSRSGRERFDAGVDMVTNMAAVLAPVVAGKMAGGADEVADVVDALLGFGGPTREAATDYAKRFAADESGAIKLPGYAIPHRPMTVEGGAATLDDLTAAFGEDIYGPNALQFFGSGDARELAVLRAMRQVRGNPDAPVKIYRGVPEGVSEINPGDWVTLDPKYASDYGAVVSREVPASHVTAWADSLAEQGYYPPIDPATQRGQEVLDLLRTGRASEVTDEMLDLGDPTLNARLNEYLFNNYDLPMDEAARMARAREMGFGDDLYHGGAADFPAFDRANRGKATSAMSAKRATWMADEPDVAGGYASFAEGGPVQDLINRSYMAEADGDFDLAEDLMRQAEELELSGASAQGGNIQPLRARGNRLSFDADGEKYDANEYVMMDKVNEAQRGGYAGLQIDNFVDNADYSDWTEATHVGIFDPRNIRSRFARFDPRLSHLRNLSAGAAGLGILGGANMQNDDNQPLRAYLGL